MNTKQKERIKHFCLRKRGKKKNKLDGRQTVTICCFSNLPQLVQIWFKCIWFTKRCGQILKELTGCFCSRRRASLQQCGRWGEGGRGWRIYYLFYSPSSFFFYVGLRDVKWVGAIYYGWNRKNQECKAIIAQN